MATRSRRLIFAAVAVSIGLALPVLAFLALDIHLHHKFERGVLVNMWAYRGPAIGRKRPGEYRVAVLGGSAAYGFGVGWEESMPRLLERRLAGSRPPITVVNLAYNSEGAYSFTYTMNDYQYLHYDLVVLYEGYNDLFSGPDSPNHSVFRHESPVFRLTGYLPLFPIVAREKASVMVYGDTRAVYQNAHRTNTVFNPNLATRASADVLRAAAEMGDSLQRQFDHLVAEPTNRANAADESVGCEGTWRHYCRSMFAAVMQARRRHVQVIVATQPYVLGAALRAAHAAQQREMAAMLQRNFGSDPDVQYLNFGDVVDLGNPALSFDRMHLTRDGNETIATALAEPVRRLAAKRGPNVVEVR